MIKSIKEIKDYGIFQDFSRGETLDKFLKFNLVYGWNGSGKSTLSKVFYSIASKTKHSSFPDGKFKLSLEDGTEVSDQNIESNPLNLYVFNSDFVHKNVNFENHKANSILVISEEKIEEAKELKELVAQKKISDDTTKKMKAELEAKKGKLEGIYTDIARTVKKSFELIDTTDQRLLNYRAPRLKEFIATNKEKIGKESLLDADAIAKNKSAAKSDQIKDIVFSHEILTLEDVKSCLEVSASLLEKSIISKKIDRLVLNPDINNWVEMGLKIHADHHSKSCEFCSSEIQTERISELNDHFSKSYQELIGDLKKNRENLESLEKKLNPKFPEITDLYEEFHEDFKENKGNFEKISKSLSEDVNNLVKKIEDKTLNPFDIKKLEIEEFVKHAEDLLESFEKILFIIENHNTKNLKFAEEVKNAQFLLELHFVSDQVIANVVSDKIEEIAEAEKKNKEISDEKDKLQEKIAALESQLITEVKGADTFNESISRFLGRKDIFLKFDEKAKGYHLLRGDQGKPATNLSEGEKTAIAFVYFVTKLNESGNDIKETIVLLDDPISSFDNNHLFHSASFIKSELEEAKQLFIFTHNFQFYRLIRDWLRTKNKIKKSSFYSIEVSKESPRKSSLAMAPQSLIDYNSEYHYIFKKLNEYKDATSLDLEKSLLIANLSRKLLEGFLSFKLPKSRNDFYQLLKDGCSDELLREKVYRFINKFSHNQVIEFQESPVDVLIGEGYNVVTDVFLIISRLDDGHYKEMMEVV